MNFSELPARGPERRDLVDCHLEPADGSDAVAPEVSVVSLEREIMRVLFSEVW